MSDAAHIAEVAKFRAHLEASAALLERIGVARLDLGRVPETMLELAADALGSEIGETSGPLGVARSVSAKLGAVTVYAMALRWRAERLG